MKTKIKSHGDEVTDFYEKEIPIIDSNYTCLAMISFDSALKKDDNNYREVVRHIHDNLSDFFYPSGESDEE